MKSNQNYQNISNELDDIFRRNLRMLLSACGWTQMSFSEDMPRKTISLRCRGIYYWLEGIIRRRIRENLGWYNFIGATAFWCGSPVCLYCPKKSVCNF